MDGIQAGIYVRISQDRDGTQLGVGRQREDCEKLAEREGWEVSEVYVENDTSASGKKPRPEYQRMLADLAAGKVQAIVAWHADRLHRHPRELEDFIEAVEKAGAAVRTVTAGDLDLSTSSGRLLARMLGGVARHESERHAERVSRKMQELAQKGQYTGGSRTFGYHTGRCCPGPGCRQPDALFHGPRKSPMLDACGCSGGCEPFATVPEEADAIREAARLLLAGQSLYAVAQWLDSRGFRTTSGGAWTGDGVKRTITNPRLAGLLVYKGKVIGEAAWAPIFDRATHEQLKVKYAPAGRTKPIRSRLLASLAVCGNCGQKMIGSYNGRKVPVYICPPPRSTAYGENWRGCGGCSIVGPKTDDEVRDRVLATLEGDGLAQALAAAAGQGEREQQLADRLVADEAALVDLTNDHYVERVIGKAEFLAAQKKLDERIAQARRELSGEDRTKALIGLPTDPAGLRAAWEFGGVGPDPDGATEIEKKANERARTDWRRALIGAVVESVVIEKAERKGQPWKPERVRLNWRA